MVFFTLKSSSEHSDPRVAEAVGQMECKWWELVSWRATSHVSTEKRWRILTADKVLLLWIHVFIWNNYVSIYVDSEPPCCSCMYQDALTGFLRLFSVDWAQCTTL